MELTRHPTAADLPAAAGEFLGAREAEHNLPLGILASLRDDPSLYPDPPYLATVADADRIALVVVRTPPYGPILSEPGVADARLGEALDLVVADLLAAAPGIPTVNGPAPVAAAFAARWSAATGRRAERVTALRAYRLTRVVPAPPVPGSWRLAGEPDRDLLVRWVDAFEEEAHPPGMPRTPGGAIVDRWVRRSDRFAYLWTVDERPVSLVVAGARTPNGRRIGPVYTPPEARGRGYASSLTAAASQDRLDRGARFCFLFTDLANPTSNAIYQRIGYEPVSDVDEYLFTAQSGD